MHKYNIVLYASNAEKREKGLMFTKPLNQDECALFVFPRAADHTFWNKNVSYPLSLIFCDSKNNVVAIKYMDANSTKPCRANNSNIKYVIEMIDGAEKNIHINDILVIDNDGNKLYFLNQ